MKASIFFILFTILSLTSVAQHRNLEWIKEYYNSINRAEKIEQLYNETVRHQTWIWMELAEIHASFGYSSDLSRTLLPDLNRTLQRVEYVANKLRDRSENVLVFLHLTTKSIENFNFSKDINDFITIDTNQTRIVYFNRRSREYIFLNKDFFGSWALEFARWERVGFGSRLQNTDLMLRRFFSFIDRTKPDVLFDGGWLFSNNFLFMKNNRVFLYDRRTRRVYDLNEFIHRFEERRFMRWAIANEQGYAVFGGD